MKIKYVDEDKQFKLTSITKEKEFIGIDLKNLYNRAIEELKLQQTKRDQIISLYVSICTVLLPVSFSIEELSNIRFIMFLFMGIIGIILAFIISRYREYKEIYWLSCITIQRLSNYKSEDLNKELIQQIFYDSILKKDSSIKQFIKDDDFNSTKYYLSLFKSAETLHYVLETFVTTLFIGISCYLFLELYLLQVLAIIVSSIVSIILFIWLYVSYCKKVLSVYNVLLDKSDDSFNKAFEKAWFLFIY